MLYKIDCKADIATQSTGYPTYKYIDCDLHTNANDIGGIKTHSFVGGTGYEALQVLTVVQAGASGGTFTIDTVDGSGVILTMTKLDSGINYAVVNNLATTVNTGGGTNATISVETINTGFYGRLIDCDLGIITDLADACTDWNQGIRTTVEIDGEPVSDALIGNINISRRKNQIATFSFQLGDSTYSPLTNSHIVPNKVVVITSYINRYEAKLFTGLIDDASASWTGDFRVTINGSGYGKKLRDTRKTLVSIQDSASSKYRNSLIKYLVEQADVTWSGSSMPVGSYTRIDHSFEDQTILDMVTKELIIDGMKWEFDEEAGFKGSYDIIKTSTGDYPNPDWTYNEDRFFYLGLRTTDDNVINDVKILGTMYETQIEVDNPEDSPSGDYIDPAPDGYDDKQLASFSKTWSQDEAFAWTDTDNNITTSVSNWGTSWWQTPPGASSRSYKITFSASGDNYSFTAIDYSCSGNFEIINSSYGTTNAIIYIKRTAVMVGDTYQAGAGSIYVTIRGKDKEVQDSPESNPPTSAIIDNEDVDSPTYEYEYDQVAAHVENQYSINKYGRRKPNSEGTLSFPLAENTNQCKGIGRKIIKDSHRFTKQPNFEIPFNPLLKVGQTVSITDKKIGYSQRWYVEEVNHTVGQGKGRTRIGCVYYT